MDLIRATHPGGDVAIEYPGDPGGVRWCAHHMFSDDPRGHLLVGRRPDGVHVAHADPRILLTGELLSELAALPGSPRGSALPEAAVVFTRAPRQVFVGAVLTIRATNRTVVYRIGEQTPELFELDLWPAEWPD